MKKTLIIASSLILIVVMVGAGCGKKAVEKTVENNIEKATNSEVDVDLNNNSIVVNTDEGTFEAGESVDIPSGFPSDVYVIDGTITAAISADESNTYSLNIQTPKSVNEAKEEYENQFESDGWDIPISMNLGGSVSMSAEKNDRTTTVTISDVDGITTIIQTTTKDE